MKQIVSLLVICLLMACSSDSKKDNQKQEETPAKPTQVNQKVAPQKTTQKETYLCKINGKDWSYTKASGIVSTDRKTKKRTALITFKRKLEKGSEHVQLEYDATTFELIKTSLNLKFENHDGKLFTCFYKVGPLNKSRHPENKMVGSIDLSNKSSASGTAESSNINIQFKKGELSDSKNATVTLSGLKFSGVGYSDLDKVANTFKKKN